MLVWDLIPGSLYLCVSSTHSPPVRCPPTLTEHSSLAPLWPTRPPLSHCPCSHGGAAEGEKGDLDLPGYFLLQGPPRLRLCLCPTFSLSSAEVAGQCPLPSPSPALIRQRKAVGWESRKLLPPSPGCLIPSWSELQGETWSDGWRVSGPQLRLSDREGRRSICKGRRAGSLGARDVRSRNWGGGTWQVPGWPHRLLFRLPFLLTPGDSSPAFSWWRHRFPSSYFHQQPWFPTNETERKNRKRQSPGLCSPLSPRPLLPSSWEGGKETGGGRWPNVELPPNCASGLQFSWSGTAHYQDPWRVTASISQTGVGLPPPSPGCLSAGKCGHSPTQGSPGDGEWAQKMHTLLRMVLPRLLLPCRCGTLLTQVCHTPMGWASLRNAYCSGQWSPCTGGTKGKKS